MNWYRELNGQIAKALVVFGAVLIGLLMVLVADWIAKTVFGFGITQVWEAVVGGLVLLTSGGAGLKYAQKHDIRKKDKE